MTDRLYFTNAYLTEFESGVKGCLPSGDRFDIPLQQVLIARDQGYLSLQLASPLTFARLVLAFNQYVDLAQVLRDNPGYADVLGVI